MADEYYGSIMGSVNEENDSIEDAKRKVKLRMHDDRLTLMAFTQYEKKIKKLEAMVHRQANMIVNLEETLAAIPGDIEADAKDVVEGKKKMPAGHYREGIKKETKFSTKYKKQC